MKIALAQLICSADKQQNLMKACQYIKKAAQAGADMILLPETFMAFIATGSKINRSDIAEPLNGTFVQGLMQAAKASAIYVVCGIYQQSDDESGKVWNTSVMINRAGELIHHYQKTHLYDAFSYQESRHIIAGNNPLTPVDTEFGKIGLLVCYELRFPEVARQLTLAGADLLLVPAAWVHGPLKEEHYQTLIKARALENTVPVCACDQTGNIYSGRSLVCDAMGVVIASAGYEERLLLAEISRQHTLDTRNTVPCVQNRRPELYC